MLSRLAAFLLLAAIARPAAAGPCDAEIAAHCPAASAADQGVNRCLEQHASELSESCGTALKHLLDAKKQTVALCKPDALKLCTPIEPGKGKGEVDACLWTNRPKLTDSCRQAIEQMHAWSFTDREKRIKTLERQKAKAKAKAKAKTKAKAKAEPAGG